MGPRDLLFKTWHLNKQLGPESCVGDVPKSEEETQKVQEATVS